MGMGNLAQQQLSGAAGGTDQVSGILQGQVGGNAGLSSLATGGVSPLGQFAQGGNAQLAAAANGQTPMGQMLQQQALGQGPSGAQTTLGQGAAQAIRAQMAAAASTRGGAAMQAAAQQQGALQGAQISGQAIGQAAQEKAAEQLSGQQQLANYTQTAMGQNRRTTGWRARPERGHPSHRRGTERAISTGRHAEPCILHAGSSDRPCERGQ